MKIFVYGTLKKGFSNHGLLERGGAQKICAAVTRPVYTMHDLGSFPGITPGGTTEITGELYEVDEETRQRLDQLESHPRFYKRTLDRVRDPYSGETHWCWLYVLTHDPHTSERVVENGIWIHGKPW